MPIEISPQSRPLLVDSDTKRVVGFADLPGETNTTQFIPSYTTDSAGKVTGMTGPDGAAVDLQSLVSVGGNAPSNYMAFAGDSRMRQAIQDLSTTPPISKINWASRAPATWVQFLSRQGWVVPKSYVVAVSGAGTAAIKDVQLPLILALSPKPRICCINGGTNSFSSNATAAQVTQSLADISSFATALIAAGIEPVIELDAPRTLASWSSASQKCSIAYNHLMRKWCRDNGVRCADTELWMMDFAGTDPVAAYMLNVSGDVGIHQTSTGGLIRALCLMDTLGDVTPRTLKRQTGNPNDTYDATLNPRGNLLTNGLMTGSSGTHMGTGASGVVPTNWRNRVISGTGTSVTSVVARDDGGPGNWCQQVLAATADGTEFRLDQSAVTTAGVATGDVIEIEADIEVTAMSGVITKIEFYGFDFTGSVNGDECTVLKNDSPTLTSSPFPPLPLLRNTGTTLLTKIAGRVRTLPLVIGNAGTSAGIYVRGTAVLNNGASATVRWGDVTIRKVL